jgi:hypothetical protein
MEMNGYESSNWTQPDSRTALWIKDVLEYVDDG